MVSKPVDLGAVRQKLLDNAYPDAEAAYLDIRLVFLSSALTLDRPSSQLGV